MQFQVLFVHKSRLLLEKGLVVPYRAHFMCYEALILIRPCIEIDKLTGNVDYGILPTKHQNEHITPRKHVFESACLEHAGLVQRSASGLDVRSKDRNE